jgi:hypothetical protein
MCSVSGQLCGRIQRRCWRPRPVSCCLSAAGLCFSGHPFPAGGLGLPCGWLTGSCCQEPDPIGIPRFTRMRCDRVGCPLDPGDGGALTTGLQSPAAACHIAAAKSLHLGHTSTVRGSPSRGIAEGSLHSPVRSSPRLWPPDGTGALGLLPGCFRPRRYQRRKPEWGQALSTDLGLRSRHVSTLLPASPLMTCDLVSHLK